MNRNDRGKVHALNSSNVQIEIAVGDSLRGGAVGILFERFDGAVGVDDNADSPGAFAGGFAH